LEEEMPMYMKWESTVRESAAVSKSMDSATTLLCQYATLGSSPFDAYADAPAGTGGTSIPSVTDMIIDPFNPGAAFKPLFAFTGPEDLV
jgi:hypothetical protein